jgi:hypothetical protein
VGIVAWIPLLLFLATLAAALRAARSRKLAACAVLAGIAPVFLSLRAGYFMYLGIASSDPSEKASLPFMIFGRRLRARPRP